MLIAPSVVLTAAHCLYNPHTRAILQPVSLHVLFGYQRDAYRWHRLVTRITVGPGFDGTKGPPQPADWARLELTEAVPVTPLPLLAGSASPGMAVALAGYNQDRAQLLMADLGCQVLRIRRSSQRRPLSSTTAPRHAAPAAPRSSSGRMAGGPSSPSTSPPAASENLALAAPFGN